jgi:hypothetical protein
MDRGRPPDRPWQCHGVACVAISVEFEPSRLPWQERWILHQRSRSLFIRDTFSMLPVW